MKTLKTKSIKYLLLLCLTTIFFSCGKEKERVSDEIATSEKVEVATNERVDREITDDGGNCFEDIESESNIKDSYIEEKLEECIAIEEIEEVSETDNASKQEIISEPEINIDNNQPAGDEKDEKTKSVPALVEKEKDADTVTEAKPVPEYTYTDCNFKLYAKITLNVRDNPNINGKKIGSVNKDQQVAVTGQCVQTGWYRIEYNGQIAYCSNNLLQSAKPVGNTTDNKSEEDSTLYNNTKTGEIPDKEKNNNENLGEDEEKTDNNSETKTFLYWEERQTMTGNVENRAGFIFEEKKTETYNIYSDGSEELTDTRYYWIDKGGSYDVEKCKEYATKMYKENLPIYEEVLKYVNELRAGTGAEPVILDETLCIMANMRALEQELVTHLSHWRPDGSYFGSVANEFPEWQYNLSGENCAYGFENAKEVVCDGWKNSNGHYLNMINPNHKYMGVGFANFWNYHWAMDFCDEDIVQ